MGVVYILFLFSPLFAISKAAALPMPLFAPVMMNERPLTLTSRSAALKRLSAAS